MPTHPPACLPHHAQHILARSLAELRASEQGLQNLTLLNPSEGPDCRLPCQPTYHLVVMQDSLHDMAHPQQMLAVRYCLCCLGALLVYRLDAAHSQLSA
jgi:hypothetical protein